MKPRRSPVKRKEKGKQASKKSPASQKASFKQELASRMEAAHEAAQYQRGVNREDLEISFGVGDYDLFFSEFENHFKRTRTRKLTKEESAEPNLKVKELSKLRWRKSRRKRRGKIKNNSDNK